VSGAVAGVDELEPVEEIPDVDMEVPAIAGALSGDILVDRGLVTYDQLMIGTKIYRRMLSDNQETTLDEVLVRCRFVTRQQISLLVDEAVVSSDEAHRARFKDAERRHLKAAFNNSMCKRLGIEVLGREDDALIVAQTRRLAAGEVREILQHCEGNHIAVKRLVNRPQDRLSTLRTFKQRGLVTEKSLGDKIERFNRNPENASLLNQIIDEMFVDAMQCRASDIHILRVSGYLGSWIQYRIDGDLRYRYILSTETASRIIVRLKQKANLDFADDIRPQDGKIPYEYDDRVIDIRVATLPLGDGERATLRLLDPENMRTMAELFADADEAYKALYPFTQIKNKTSGFILVTGPTGSGKTTTLYSMVTQFARHRLNVGTAESPIEITLPLVSQVQVNPLRGLTFGAIIRAHMRHDPDVLLIGEMRDDETASAATTAVDSGHLTLGTLHAPDARLSIQRLIGLLAEEERAQGIFIIASFLKVVINQRLGKRLCVHCRRQSVVGELAEPVKSDALRLGLSEDETINVAHPRGCPHCGHVGYKDRVMLPETFVLPDDLAVRLDIARKMADDDWGAVFSNPNVFFESREQVVVKMIRRGIIDVLIGMAALKAS